MTHLRRVVSVTMPLTIGAPMLPTFGQPWPERALANLYARQHESSGATVVTSRRAGDFDAFFSQNYWSIVRSLTAAFGDQEAAAEAVQDAFIKAYARWRRVRGLDAPAAWVRHVALNKLRDQHRRSERVRRAEDAAGVLEDTHTLPPEHDEIVRLLQPLPERQRTAMALYYIEDLPVAEIAASMGISQGAVKAHLSQARANVESSLESNRSQR